jgi:hypothetical protein
VALEQLSLERRELAVDAERRPVASPLAANSMHGRLFACHYPL